MITEIAGTCQYQGCRRKATQIACGRDRTGDATPGCYCDAHAEKISEQEQPEYVVSCPNCGCGFGVN